MKFCLKSFKKKQNKTKTNNNNKTNQKHPFLCQGWLNFGTGCPERLKSPSLEDSHNLLDTHWSSRARVGILKRSLPTKRSLSFSVTKSKKINNSGEAHGSSYTEFISVISYSEWQVLSGSCRQIFQLYYTGSHVSHLKTHTDFIVFLEVEELQADTERQQ